MNVPNALLNVSARPFWSKGRAALKHASRGRLAAVLAGTVFIILAPVSSLWWLSNKSVQTHTFLSYAGDALGKPLQLRKRDLQKLNTLCLGKYNYWCIKTPSGTKWDGQVGKDTAGHAIFKDPVYAARAFTRVMRTYNRKHNLKSAREIISRYAPASDCIGSRSYCPSKTASKTPAQTPAKTPAQKIPGYTEGGDCPVRLMYCPYGFNPTNDYAEAIAKAVGKGPDEDLGLFDPKGRVNLAVAVPLFTAFSRWELGAEYKVKPALIIRGALKEHRDYHNL